MGMVLNIQLSAFCNCRIEPNVKNVTSLMEKLNSFGVKEFLPNVQTGQKINMLQQTVDMAPFLGFITADQSGQIVCKDERIDCIFSFKEENQGDFDENVESMQQIICMILKEHEVIANRLAININLLSDAYAGRLQDTDFGRSLVSTLDFYREKELKDWASRENVRHPVKIADKEEMLNVITELNTVTDNSGEEKRLLCHMDINTIHENQEYRFDDQKMQEFINEVKDIVINIKTNFEELSRDGNE